MSNRNPITINGKDTVDVNNEASVDADNETSFDADDETSVDTSDETSVNSDHKGSANADNKVSVDVVHKVSVPINHTDLITMDSSSDDEPYVPCLKAFIWRCGKEGCQSINQSLDNALPSMDIHLLSWYVDRCPTCFEQATRSCCLLQMKTVEPNLKSE